MSTFEQNIEQKDKRYQYILFAAEPYDTVAFKIPNRPIDKDSNKLFTHWNEDTYDFTFQMYFERENQNGFPGYKPRNLDLDWSDERLGVCLIVKCFKHHRLEPSDLS